MIMPNQVHTISQIEPNISIFINRSIDAIKTFWQTCYSMWAIVMYELAKLNIEGDEFKLQHSANYVINHWRSYSETRITHCGSTAQ